VGFETYTQDADLSPFFSGPPNDECQCVHMGYVIKIPKVVRTLLAEPSLTEMS
jgi:hypothetical protein